MKVPGTGSPDMEGRTRSDRWGWKPHLLISPNARFDMFNHEIKIGRDMSEIDINFITDWPSEVLIGHHGSLIRLNPPRYGRVITAVDTQVEKRV
eukprot:4979963-Prymnesium_polylepis.1